MGLSQVRPGCRSPFREALLASVVMRRAWQRLARRYRGASLRFLDERGRPILLTPHRTPPSIPNSTPWMVTWFDALDGELAPAGHSLRATYEDAIVAVREYGGRLTSAELPRVGTDVIRIDGEVA